MCYNTNYITILSPDGRRHWQNDEAVLTARSFHDFVSAQEAERGYMVLKKLRETLQAHISSLLIIFPAIFLRFVNLWYVEFKSDEAMLLAAARNLVEQGRIALVGSQSSIGIYFGPFFTYLIAIPSAFSHNPVVISGFIALLNVAAIYLCYLFCSEFFNKRVACIASTLYAVNPWAVLFSRKIWNPDALPIFTIIFFYSLFKALLKHEYVYIIASLLAFGIMTQLHLQAICYVLILLIAIALFRPKIPSRYYLIGVGSVIMLYLPYLLFEIRHHFYNTKMVLMLSKGLPLSLNAKALVFPAILSSWARFPTLSPLFVLPDLSVLVPFASMIYIVFLIKDKRCLLLLLWLLTPILFALIGKVSLQAHYFISLYPVQFISCGIFFDAIAVKLRKKDRAIHLLYACFYIFIAYQFAFSSCFFGNFIKEEKNIRWEQYGPPFKYRVDEIKKLMDSGETKPEDIQKKLLQDKPGNLSYKYDFGATKYIAENISAITKR